MSTWSEKLKHLRDSCKKIGQKIVDVIVKPFKNVVHSVAESAASGAAQGALQGLETIGVNKEYIKETVTPTLEGVTSIGELAKSIQPWVNPLAAASMVTCSAVTGYLILSAISSFYQRKQLTSELNDIQTVLKEIENNTQFQNLILLKSLQTNEKILSLNYTSFIGTWSSPEARENLLEGARNLVERQLAEAEEYLRKPKPFILTNEMIEIVSLAMSPYLERLLCLPKKITTNEELLGAVNENMNFESFISAIENQTFSDIKLTVKNAINFNYLNKISEGAIGELTDLVKKEFLSKNKTILFFANNLGHAVSEAQKLALSNPEENLILSGYKYNLKDCITNLASQYRIIKNELLSEDIMGCDQELTEKIVNVVLNRALLNMFIDLRSSLTYKNNFLYVALVSVPVHLAANFNCISRPVAMACSVTGSLIAAPVTRDSFLCQAGALTETIHYYGSKTYSSASTFFSEKSNKGTKRKASEDSLPGEPPSKKNCTNRDAPSKQASLVARGTFYASTSNLSSSTTSSTGSSENTNQGLTLSPEPVVFSSNM